MARQKSSVRAVRVVFFESTFLSALTRFLTSQTSTTLGQSTIERSALDDPQGSAVADTRPEGRLSPHADIADFRQANHDKSSEPLSAQFEPGFLIFIWSSVTHLLRDCRPPAVVRHVMSIIIDTIKRQALRAWSHIDQKVLEATQPAFTDSDTATAVVLELVVIRIQAPAFHRCPRAVLTSCLLPCGLAVLVMHGVS